MRENPSAHRFQNHVTSQSNSTAQPLQRDGVDACQSGNASKVIPKSPGLRWNPANCMPYKRRKSGTALHLARSGHPAKISQRAKEEVKKNSYFNVQGSATFFCHWLQTVFISPPSKMQLKKNRIGGTMSMQKPQLTRKKNERLSKVCQKEPRWSLRVKTILASYIQ